MAGDRYGWGTGLRVRGRDRCSSGTGLGLRGRGQVRLGYRVRVMWKGQAQLGLEHMPRVGVGVTVHHLHKNSMAGCVV